MLTEIVRLPVPMGEFEPALNFLRGHAYFRQEALISHRFFRNEDEGEVMLILEWTSREEMQATTDNELSTKLRADLAPLLAGESRVDFYASAD